jgi:predicted metal-dependent enzyme (double-stranded beta helix superfamily)
MAFDLDRFVDDCRALAHEGAASVGARVAKAVAEPAAIAAALPEPDRAGFQILHRAGDLTILNFSWPAWICFKPHNHQMWSVVGIFSGREDNVFWRRVEDRIEAAGARSLGTRDVTTLGHDIIHSVYNPIGRMTRAIHVYGGDFFAPPRPRSEWDPETLVERSWDLEGTERQFREAQARAHH